MTPADVAACLHVSPQRVRQLDSELCPERCLCGARRYSAELVAAFVAKREADRAALSKARASRINAIREKYQPRRRKAPGNP